MRVVGGGDGVSQRTRATRGDSGRAFAVGSVVVAWLVAVGVDLLFNAGVFAPLFEQAREPSLLTDEELFRRVPVAYIALFAGVAALAWLLDRLTTRGMAAGMVVGATAGVVTAALGVVSLWTAVDLTAVFVLAAIVVQIGQFAAAGAVLGGHQRTRSRRRFTVLCLAGALLMVVGAIVTQNVVGGFE